MKIISPDNQALERTAPVLPMIPGIPERRSHDYVRHGTIGLFAALNTATGKVIGKLSAQHRTVDFRDFPDEIDRQVEPGLAVHVICDNLPAHKAPAVHRWLLATIASCILSIFTDLYPNVMISSTNPAYNLTAEPSSEAGSPATGDARTSTDAI